MNSINFPAIADKVVTGLLGDPTEKNGNDWRYNGKGSLSVDIGKATFFDHENQEGGGLLDLIKRVTGQDGMAWMEDNGHLQEASPQATTSPVEYVYCNSDGEPVHKVTRSQKDGRRQFTQSRFEGGKWLSGTKGVTTLPYRLPDIVSRPSDTIYVVEGEKDADALAAQGLLATCNAGGAGNWKPSLNAYFNGRHVVIIPDNDGPGAKHADKVIAELSLVAGSITRLELSEHWPDMPEKGDVSDFLEAGFTVEQLQQFSSEAGNKDLLFELQAAKARNLLETQPPPRRYVVNGFLPEPIAGAIVAPGGVGKSFFLMQLGASVASGRHFFGMPVAEPGGVMMLAAEDDTDELARRLHEVTHSGWSKAERDALAENFYPVSRLAENNRITHKADGVIEWHTALIMQIVSTANAIENLRLIILDPVSRFRSGDENASEDATKFVEALEIIRKHTGVTVLCAHHSRKGSTGESQDDIRGASAFVDALRFAATLYVPSPKDAKALGIPDDERRSWVRMSVVKSNYKTDVEELWLRRGSGGVLTPTAAPKGRATTDAESRAEDRYFVALPKLKRLIREAEEKGDPLTKRKARDYAGTSGLFGMGDQSLRGVIGRALAEKEIFLTSDDKLTVTKPVCARCAGEGCNFCERVGTLIEGECKRLESD